MKKLTTELVFNPEFKVTPKILEKFIKESKKLPKNICTCECHNCNILNMHHHNAISVISRFKCIECQCLPIPYSARQFDLLNSKFRQAWKKMCKLQYWNNGYPRWIMEESIFMNLLLQILLKESK